MTPTQFQQRHKTVTSSCRARTVKSSHLKLLQLCISPDQRTSPATSLQLLGTTTLPLALHLLVSIWMICFYKLIFTVKSWQDDQTNNFNLFHFSRSLSQQIKISSSLNKNNLQLFIANQLEYLNIICHTFWALSSFHLHTRGYIFSNNTGLTFFPDSLPLYMSPCVGEPCMCYCYATWDLGPWWGLP